VERRVSRIARVSRAAAAATASALEWLSTLDGATRVDAPGRDRSRRRAFVTLAHANEPSGLLALHRWLAGGAEPVTDLSAYVLSVEAARAEPAFGQRMPPGERDLNRCFGGPYDDPPGRLARALLDDLFAVAPEALVDVHNTSGRGPAYGVTTGLDDARIALARLFADHVILSDLRLGTLHEAVETLCPAIVVECGGARDPAAHEVAFRGLERFASAPRVTALAPDGSAPRVLAHPVRVELAAGATVEYAPAPVAGADLTLLPDVDRHNFDPVQPDEALGWLGPRGLAALRARDAGGRDLCAELFEVRAGRLHPRHALDLLMVTTDSAIARADCLFYAVPPEPA
jgi:hypothetical protein